MWFGRFVGEFASEGQLFGRDGCRRDHLEYRFSAPIAAAAHMDDAKCTALHNNEFADLTDAPTTINTAAVQAATNDLPAYCQVEGYVAPQVGFILRLPTDNWNGKGDMHNPANWILKSLNSSLRTTEAGRGW